MDLIMQFVDIFLHLDHYLGQMIADYGLLTYLILTAVIFMETGLVVTPFLPGDSLLFAAGALSATTILNVWVLFPVLFVAAFLGDTVNYSIGHFIGPKVFTQDSRLLKKEYLDKTQAFYDKHGGKTIFLARFVPIIRTFAPFVAGVGKMRYSYFITYNIVGAFVWTGLFLFGGYFFGNLKFVADNFSIVILAIIAISLMPPVVEFLKEKREIKKAEQAGEVTPEQPDPAVD